MSTDDSIRTDASTVHRSPVNINAANIDAARLDAGRNDAATTESNRREIDRPTAEAQTVIRTIASLSDSHCESDVGSVIPVQGSNLQGSGLQNPGTMSAPMDRTPAAVAKVLLGQRLNHFLLEEMIGGGGMGAVFRGHDEQLDRTVAIKVIPFVSEDADLQRRFRNESQSAAKLDHPRIAKVFDTGNHGQWHYIVFEYVEGINIRDWVQEHGPLSIDEAVFYTVQLADALQHASSRGIVHRDIKPSNVLIATDGKIKLVDMGLARSESLELSEDMTASGVTLGTFDYISPEQAGDPRDADLRSDLYSLGCTLYFMLTGSPPYPGGTMLQKLLSHGNAPPPDARALRKEVSVNLVAVIQKMLAKKPADRYQNANDLIADLHVVAARDGLTRSRQAGNFVASEPNPMIAWIERHVPWVVAVALLVTVAGWLHLESAVSRDEVVVPASAKRPIRVVTPKPVLLDAGTIADPSMIDASGPGDGPGNGPVNGLGNVPVNGPRNVLGTGSSTVEETFDATATPTGGTSLAIVPTLGTPRLTDFPVPPELMSAIRNEGRLPESRFSDLPNENRAALEPPVDARGPASLLDAGKISDLNATALAPVAVLPIDKSRVRGASTDNPARSIEVPIKNDPATNPNSRPPFAPTVVRVVGQSLEQATQTESTLRFDSSGAALASSLSEALRIAAQYSLTRIDIAVPTLFTEPVRVDVDHLRITSSVGGGSVIVFQPAPRMSMERAEMFSIGNHPIEFNDLHFVWNVPSDELDGGAMFTLHDNRSVELTDCTITIDNPSLRDEVFAFDIVTDPAKQARRSPTLMNVRGAIDSVTATRRRGVDVPAGVPDVFPLVDMKLYNVIVRGQMSMIHMDYAAKLWLDWDNGLLAVTDRMVDTAGARLPPPAGSGAIKLSMMRVTAHVPKGILRTRLGVSGPHPVPIERLARKSVFVVDNASPHFEITGLPPQDLNRQWLEMEGSGNAYVVDPALTDPLLQISTTDGQVETTRFGDLSETPPSWVDENRPRWSVKWASVRQTDVAAGNRRAEDYRQIDAVSPSGFDEKSLPTLPIAGGPVFDGPAVRNGSAASN